MQIHSIDKYAYRIRTPPYVSAKPDVYYHKLRRDRRRNGTGDPFLILCSDGLVDLRSGATTLNVESLANRWAQVVGREIDKESSGRSSRANLAMKLLRDAIGGDDMHLSRVLTVEMEERWIDDTTIIVQRFM